MTSRAAVALRNSCSFAATSGNTHTQCVHMCARWGQSHMHFYLLTGRKEKKKRFYFLRWLAAPDLMEANLMTSFHRQPFCSLIGAAVTLFCFFLPKRHRLGFHLRCLLARCHYRKSMSPGSTRWESSNLEASPAYY